MNDLIAEIAERAYRAINEYRRVFGHKPSCIVMSGELYQAMVAGQTSNIFTQATAVHAATTTKLFDYPIVTVTLDSGIAFELPGLTGYHNSITVAKWPELYILLGGESPVDSTTKIKELTEVLRSMVATYVTVSQQTCPAIPLNSILKEPAVAEARKLLGLPDPE